MGAKWTATLRSVFQRFGGPRSVVAVCPSAYGRDRSASLQQRHLVAALGRVRGLPYKRFDQADSPC